MLPPRLLFVSLALALSALPALAVLPAARQAFVEQWCADCHDGSSKKGGLDFDTLGTGADEASHAAWVRVFDKVLAGEMPPAKKAQPEAAARRSFLAALGGDLQQQHAAQKGTTLRRLNRTEYENTLSDLLGTRVAVRDLLPEDTLSHGFDNVGSALSMSEVQLAAYLEAAQFALTGVLSRVTKPETKRQTFTYQKEAERATSWLVRSDGAVVIFNDGFPNTTMRDLRAPADGRYRIHVRVETHQATAPIVFSLQSGKFGQGTVIASHGYQEIAPGAPQTITQEVWLQAGDALRLWPELKVDFKLMQTKGPATYPGPGLAVFGVELEGPLLDQWPPRGIALLLGDLAAGAKEAPERKGARGPRPLVEIAEPNAAAQLPQLLRNFAEAAFRHPVSEAEAQPYLQLAQSELQRGVPFTMALRTAATAILCSPDFLFLREAPGRLDDFALASRLSYFLWRTMPDDELLRLATRGELRKAATLRAQTERLLSDPKAERFINDFTDAWLNLRDIGFTTPDKKLYPEYDDVLQAAMLDESRGFFTELVRANLSPLKIVASDFTLLNQRLAEHYGIPGVQGVAMRKVAVPPGIPRGGVLTQGAVLKVSANGTNTSPVVRGAWVLERILGTAPTPPPPGIPGVEPDIRGATTLREQLAQHRNLESCQGCHRVIDPPGFALESFDAIGGWREKFRTLDTGETKFFKANGRSVRVRLGLPVDATGELADGTKFGGFEEYRKLLLAQPEKIHRALAEKLLVFGSGRELGFSDRQEVTKIARRLATQGGGVRDLIHLVVGSSIFQSK